MWKCRHCEETAQRDFKRCRRCGRARIPRQAQRFSSAGMPTQRLTQPAAQAFCARCQSSRVIPRVRVADQMHGGGAIDASLVVERNPRALLFKDGVSIPLYARVCGNCGYTELYASSPEALWEAYQAALTNG